MIEDSGVSISIRRKRKRAEAIFDLTCDRSSAQKFEYAAPEHNLESEAVGIRHTIAGSALHINGKYCLQLASCNQLCFYTCLSRQFAHSCVIAASHAGAQQGYVVPSINGKAARSTRSTICRPAPSASKDSCYEGTSKRFASNHTNLHPIMNNNPAQHFGHKQQHAHAQGAAASDERSQHPASPRQAVSCQANSHHSDSHQASPHQACPHQAGLFQADPHQQIHLHTVAERCTAKQDSFQMISSAMAGRSAGRLCLPGCLHYQGSPPQGYTHACTQEQPPCKQHRAVNIAESAALPAAHAGRPIPCLPEVLH